LPFFPSCTAILLLRIRSIQEPFPERHDSNNSLHAKPLNLLFSFLISREEEEPVTFQIASCLHQGFHLSLPRRRALCVYAYLDQC